MYLFLSFFLNEACLACLYIIFTYILKVHVVTPATSDSKSVSKCVKTHNKKSHLPSVSPVENDFSPFLLHCQENPAYMWRNNQEHMPLLLPPSLK